MSLSIAIYLHTHEVPHLVLLIPSHLYLSLSLSLIKTCIMPSSTLSHMFDLSSSASASLEQICYVQCGFCTTILLVSVPCSSMSMVVTVRCGHCTSLLSVNMMKASFVPFHLLAASLEHRNHDIVADGHPPRQSMNKQQEELEQVVSPEAEEDHEEGDQKGTLLLMNSSTCDDNEDPTTNLNRTINKPPEKRQRAPSAYNCFIKEEIKRLKSENPTMPHKEAFSMAAKNWAHFPPVHYRVEEDGDGDQIR
ncbi:Axial regulator YABBY 4 [Linum grandiflorum]